MGVLFLAAYLAKRDIKNLCWSAGFLGIWVLWHQLVAAGTYEGLIYTMGTSMFVLPSTMLPLLIPGMFATGLCFAKSKKIGMIYFASLIGLTSIYLAFIYVAGISGGMDRCMPPVCNPPVITVLDPPYAYLTSIAAGLGFFVQGVSVIAIIVLPFLGDNRLVSKIYTAVAGGLMLFVNTIFSLLALEVIEMAALQDIPETIIDPVTLDDIDPVNWFTKFVPILFALSALILLYGITTNKKWGFEFPGIEFKEKE
jgi:hypothetical protein